MCWLRACYYPVKMISYARHWKWWERVWHFANVPWNNSKAILSFEFFNIQVNIRVLTKVNVFHLWNTKCYIAKKKKKHEENTFQRAKNCLFPLQYSYFLTWWTLGFHELKGIIVKITLEKKIMIYFGLWSEFVLSLPLWISFESLPQYSNVLRCNPR